MSTGDIVTVSVVAFFSGVMVAVYLEQNRLVNELVAALNDERTETQGGVKP